VREQLQLRLEELKREFETGQMRLRELERQQLSLRETLLRISGAIQVLEELLAETKPGEENQAPFLEPQQVSTQAE
jgi:predicted nuclease with TOPRIM domain